MLFVKYCSLTIEKHLKQENLSLTEENGIFQLGLNSIEVKENISSESDFLVQY